MSGASPALMGLDEVAVACGVIHLDGNDQVGESGEWLCALVDALLVNFWSRLSLLLI